MLFIGKGGQKGPAVIQQGICRPYAALLLPEMQTVPPNYGHITDTQQALEMNACIFKTGQAVEAAAAEHVNEVDHWRAQPFGQDAWPNHTKKALHSRYMALNDPKAAAIINRLPKGWRDIYVKGLAANGEGIPLFERHLPDIATTYKNMLPFFLECKSTTSPTENWSVEITSILSVLIAREFSNVPRFFCFPPSEVFSYWTGCALSTLINSVISISAGSKNNGSGKPYVLIPKQKIASDIRYVMKMQEELLDSGRLPDIIKPVEGWN